MMMYMMMCILFFPNAITFESKKNEIVKVSLLSILSTLTK